MKVSLLVLLAGQFCPAQSLSLATVTSKVAAISFKDGKEVTDPSGLVDGHAISAAKVIRQGEQAVAAEAAHVDFTAATQSSGLARRAAAMAPAPAPAVAAAPGPAAPPASVKGYRVSLELANINYDDMEKSVDTSQPGWEGPKLTFQVPERKAAASSGSTTYSSTRTAHHADGKKSLKWNAQDSASQRLDTSKDEDKDKAETLESKRAEEALMQIKGRFSSGLVRVSDVVRSAIQGVFQDIIEDGLYLLANPPPPPEADAPAPAELESIAPPAGLAPPAAPQPAPVSVSGEAALMQTRRKAAPAPAAPAGKPAVGPAPAPAQPRPVTEQPIAPPGMGVVQAHMVMGKLAGTGTVQVDTTDGFEIGDMVMIGDEVKTIVAIEQGVGDRQLHLASPLMEAHEPGTVVIVVTETPAEAEEEETEPREPFDVYIQLQPGQARPVDMAAAERVADGQGLYLVQEPEVTVNQAEPEYHPDTVVYQGETVWKPRVVWEPHVDIAASLPMGPVGKPAVPIKEPTRDKHYLRHMNRKKKTVDNVGKTTFVEATVTQLAGNAMDELPAIKAILEKAVENGDLEVNLRDRLAEVVGIQAYIQHMFVEVQEITQWSVDSCSSHMATVVAKFSAAYTRREVPMAIFNECTNFMPALTFSHDHHPTKLDVRRCKDATVNFVNYWNYGKPQWKYGYSHEVLRRAPPGWGVPPPQQFERPQVESNSEYAPGPPSGRWVSASHPTSTGFVEVDEFEKLEVTASLDAPTPPAAFRNFCFDVCQAKYGDDAPWCHAAEDLELGN